MTHKKVQPDSLARFGQAARKGQSKSDKPGLYADDETAPIPTDSEQKDDAATRVLREGTMGVDEGADEAVKDLPDRITQNR
jgi:hypothetical protein